MLSTTDSNCVITVMLSVADSIYITTTQGNYATQDSSGMCHLMQRQHLPEWREEDERVFEHFGISGLNHAITST